MQYSSIVKKVHAGESRVCLNDLNVIPYFTVEAPTCFDSYNQPRLGGGRLFEHAVLLNQVSCLYSYRATRC